MRIDGITVIQLSSPFPSAGIIQIRFAGVGGIFGRPLSPAKPSSPTCIDYSIFKCGIRESDTRGNYRSRADPVSTAAQVAGNCAGTQFPAFPSNTNLGKG